MMGRLIFVTGGARSGKSSFAETLARRHPGRVCYVATAAATDDEMAERIARHRQRRPADWSTHEVAGSLAVSLSAAAREHDLILVDCVTIYLARLLPSDLSEDRAVTGTLVDQMYAATDREVKDIVAAVRRGRADTIVVSNEVGSGPVPPYPSGRLFRDIVGRANQALAQQADRAYVVVAGMPLDLSALRASELAW
jgi:adenosylcobinamide kinase / adenosylcobinamide-phosphate guanylyltransferase